MKFGAFGTSGTGKSFLTVLVLMKELQGARKSNIVLIQQQPVVPSAPACYSFRWLAGGILDVKVCN
jgi:hypothetical protein